MNELIKREDLKATYLTEKGLIICDKIEGKIIMNINPFTKYVDHNGYKSAAA